MEGGCKVIWNSRRTKSIAKTDMSGNKKTEERQEIEQKVKPWGVRYAEDGATG